MSVSDWIRQFRALHAESKKGTLTPEELQAYRGACDEFARALMGAQKQVPRPGEPPRYGLRVARAVQVELESAVTQARVSTVDLGATGFSAILAKAPKVGDAFEGKVKLPGGDPVEVALTVSDLKIQPGSVRVTFAFGKLPDATRERIAELVIDTALSQIAA
jgi:hypothetical protein